MRSFLPHLLECNLLNRFNILLSYSTHYMILINHLTELWLLVAGHHVLASCCRFSPSCPVRVLVRHPDQQISISFKKLHIIAPFHTILVILPRYHNQSRHRSKPPTCKELKLWVNVNLSPPDGCSRSVEKHSPHCPCLEK
jgi:hypothetical protein